MFKQKFKRCYLVDKHFQLSQALAVVSGHLLVALCSALMTVLFYLFVLDRRLVHSHNLGMLGYLATLALLLMAGGLFFSVRRSHRIVGVILKLDNLFKDMARGIFPDEPIRLRKTDYFHWITPSLGQAMQACQRQALAHQALNDELLCLERALEQQDCQTLAQVLRDLQEIRRKYPCQRLEEDEEKRDPKIIDCESE